MDPIQYVLVTVLHLVITLPPAPSPPPHILSMVSVVLLNVVKEVERSQMASYVQGKGRIMYSGQMTLEK